MWNTTAELFELARAIRAAPDTSTTRQALDRFDRGEIGARQAIEELRREITRAQSRISVS